MIKHLILFVILLAGIANAQPFTLIYWIRGTVSDVSGQTVNGQKICFANDRAWDIIGEKGNSGKANSFLINAGEAGLALTAGQKYQLFTRTADGWGVGPVDVILTGKGIESVGALTYIKGGGLIDLPASAVKTFNTENAPVIKLWFGNRLYQRLAKGEKFIVSESPEIKARFSIDGPYALSADPYDFTISLDPGKVSAKSVTAVAVETSDKVMAAGAKPGENKLTAFSQKYSLSKPLSEGEHVFVVTAHSGGTRGHAMSVSEYATVEVMGGPSRLVGPPLTYPSPFSISRQKIVTIQYRLSADANIDIYVIGIGGVRAKKFTLMAGGEGSSAGVNKVTWDGRTDFGVLAGNSIYIGTIISRDDNRLLGKFKCQPKIETSHLYQNRNFTF